MLFLCIISPFSDTVGLDAGVYPAGVTVLSILLTSVSDEDEVAMRDSTTLSAGVSGEFFYIGVSVFGWSADTVVDEGVLIVDPVLG